ncbi:MAG TPA: hypothetical protein VFV43_01775 [Limnobacter sp.]|nr:hypothetical protein [Limnobacter sp.]
MTDLLLQLAPMAMAASSNGVAASTEPSPEVLHAAQQVLLDAGVPESDVQAMTWPELSANAFSAVLGNVQGNSQTIAQASAPMDEPEKLHPVQIAVVATTPVLPEGGPVAVQSVLPPEIQELPFTEFQQAEPVTRALPVEWPSREVIVGSQEDTVAPLEIRQEPELTASSSVPVEQLVVVDRPQVDLPQVDLPQVVLPTKVQTSVEDGQTFDVVQKPTSASPVLIPQTLANFPTLSERLTTDMGSARAMPQDGQESTIAKPDAAAVPVNKTAASDTRVIVEPTSRLPDEPLEIVATALAKPAKPLVQQAAPAPEEHNMPNKAQLALPVKEAVLVLLPNRHQYPKAVDKVEIGKQPPPQPMQTTLLSDVALRVESSQKGALLAVKKSLDTSPGQQAIDWLQDSQFFSDRLRNSSGTPTPVSQSVTAHKDQPLLVAQPPLVASPAVQVSESPYMVVLPVQNLPGVPRMQTAELGLTSTRADGLQAVVNEALKTIEMRLPGRVELSMLLKDGQRLELVVQAQQQKMDIEISGSTAQMMSDFWVEGGDTLTKTLDTLGYQLQTLRVNGETVQAASAQSGAGLDMAQQQRGGGREQEWMQGAPNEAEREDDSTRPSALLVEDARPAPVSPDGAVSLYA